MSRADEGLWSTGGNHTEPKCSHKFFLVSPELARLDGEAQQMAGMNMQIHHHDLSTAGLVQHKKNIEKLLHAHMLHHWPRIARTYPISSQRLSCQMMSNMSSADEVK